MRHVTRRLAIGTLTAAPLAAAVLGAGLHPAAAAAPQLTIGAGLSAPAHYRTQPLAFLGHDVGDGDGETADDGPQSQVGNDGETADDGQGTRSDGDGETADDGA